MTLIKRQHPDYDLATILIRAAIHTMRRFLPGLDEASKAVIKLREKLEKLANKEPAHVTAKCMFIKSLVEAAKARAMRQGVQLTHGFLLKVFKNTGRRWNQLSAAQQQPFRRQAAEHRARCEERQADEHEQLTQQLLVADMRAQEGLIKARDIPLNNFSSCSLTDQDIQIWQRMYDRLTPKGPRGWEKRWDDAQKAPRPLQPHEEAQLDQHEVITDTAARERLPPWVNAVASLRDQIRPCGLRITSADGSETVVKVLFCKQRRPLQVHCVLVHPAAPLQPDPLARHEPWFEDFLVRFHHNFVMHDPPQLVGWQELPRARIEEVEVIPHFVIRPGGMCCSDFDFMPLQTFIDCQVHKTTKEAADTEEQAAKRPRPERPYGEEAQQFPGLHKLLTGATQAPGASSSGVTPIEEPVFAEAEAKDLMDDEDLEELFEILEDERLEPHGIEGLKLVNFKCSLRSAPAKDRALGHRFSGWQGQVTRHSEAARWCQAKGLQQTMQFDLEELGDQEAEVLCQAWASRMQYMYTSWGEGLMGTEPLIRETMDRYVEPPDFVALANKNEDPWRYHVNRIRRMLPRE